MKHALLVDRIRAKSWRELSGREILTDRGWRLTVLTDRPGPEHMNAGSNTFIVVVPELTTESIRAAVMSVSAVCPLDAISTTSELFLDVLAALRDDLGIPGQGSPYTDTLRDKWKMKEIARQSHMAHAEGVLGNELDAACDLLSRHSRCVVKPRRLSGSRGIRIVGSPDELRDWANDCPDPSAFLVEEFVHGPLAHLDGLARQGQVIWQLSQYERPTHLAGGRHPLSSFTVDDPVLLVQAEAFIRTMVSGWSMTDEVFHAEVFVTRHGLVLCEVAGRPGGAGVTQVFAATRGVDLRHAKTLLDLGEEMPEATTKLSRAGGWSVFYPTGKRFGGVDDRGLVGHDSCEIRLRPGAPVSGEAFSGVGVATYIFLGDDTAEVRQKIRRYEHGVRIFAGSGELA